MLAINIDDVINVLNSCKNYLIALAVIAVIAVIVMIAVSKKEKPVKKLIRSQSWIALLLAVVVIVNMICFGPMNSMISLATGKGSIEVETSDAATALCEDIAEEGIVLLENKDQVLPLAGGSKLNVFGWSSTNPLYGGTGSGGLSDAYPTVTLLEGLKNAGFEVNQELVDFYTEFKATRPIVGMWGQDWSIPEPSMDDYEKAGIFESAKEYSDTAIVVLARSGGEGADLPTSLDPSVPDDFKDGGTFGSSGLRYSEYKDDLDASKHYLELSNREKAMLDRVTEDYDNVVLLVNSSNTMELGFVEEYEQIKSVVWCPGTGQSGFNSLGKILSGEVNPSGKTADTFAADLLDTPTANNFGFFNYDNMDEFATDEGLPSFVNYNDGIYVGYRFWETASDEGLINYDEKVVYPFGYGLSYTSFEQEMGDLTVEDGKISVDVTVTNTGDAAGKEVVELYYNPPYTNGGIEKASVNLAGFAKTGILEPGESETVTVSFTEEEMASYDYKDAGAYVLEEGEYAISLRSDSHTVIDERIHEVAETTVYNEESPRSTDVEAASNKLGFADNEEVIYLSRADGFANYEEAIAAPTNFSMSDEHKATFMNNSNYNPEDYNNDEDEMPTTGAKNGIKLVEMRGAGYDDAKWEDLLDQLTISEMDSLIALGGYQTTAAASIGKVQTIDCDGPASINNNFTGKGSIGFPAGVMIANTFNVDLATAFGQSIGEMANQMGVSGWYAPAMNTHRSAFAGRNFEYYSEDPFLSGAIASKAVAGAEENGVYAYIKHFALNDQETNRNSQLCTWFNEQSAREIYLKPFEMCVKAGGAKAVMSAFNFYGTEPAGASNAMLNEVLRGEWGFRGFVLTDYYGVYGYQDADRMIRNGNDCMLVAYDTETNHVTDQKSATSVKAMRQACKNILYTTVNSRAYDEANLQTGMQTWQIIAIVIDVILAAILVALEVVAVKKFNKRKAEANEAVKAE